MKPGDKLDKRDLCNIVVQANFNSLKGRVLSSVLNKFQGAIPFFIELNVGRSIFILSGLGTHFLTIQDLINILKDFGFDYYEKLVCINPNYTRDNSIVDGNTKILEEVFEEINNAWIKDSIREEIRYFDLKWT